MKTGYDYIARYYDPLARMVFGHKLHEPQKYLLDFIPQQASVLVAGGGTGQILEELAMRHQGLNIVFVDASAEMIRHAKLRRAGSNKVTFIASPIERVVFQQRFDVVLTPFLLDNFSQEQLQIVVGAIDGSLSQEGIWLNCDFRDTKSGRHRWLLRMMYLAFRVCCGIGARELPDMAGCFSAFGYQPAACELFMNGFISAEVYKKAAL